MKVVLSYDAPVPAPVKKGQVIGSLKVTATGMPEMTIPVAAGADIEEGGFFVGPLSPFAVARTGRPELALAGELGGRAGLVLGGTGVPTALVDLGHDAAFHWRKSTKRRNPATKAQIGLCRGSS